jgi:farnesyl diphosphate synthase
MKGESAPELAQYLSERRQTVEAALARILPAQDAAEASLAAAMRYSVLAGGKRLRPILFLAAFEACTKNAENTDQESVGPLDPERRAGLAEAAAALELFHTYSLIHDDLPCMDDDSLRRGRPTCHVVFGEALALLAGDTLQTLGFEVLATSPRDEASAARRAESVAVAARAIGLSGMAGGQALDLAAGGHAHGPHALERLREIHAKKTGRLIEAALVIGALHAGAGPVLRSAVSRYGELLGLLFQIADDLLDVTSDSSTLGKTAGKDDAQSKLTYPALFGVEGARRELERTLEEASSAAREIARSGTILGALADYAAHRDR